MTAIKSMTGFGAADGRVGTARVSVEIRSVNHRFFNPTVKLPNQLTKWEAEVREALRRGLARGHVTVTARLDRDDDGEARIDEVRFERYVRQLRDLQGKHGLS